MNTIMNSGRICLLLLLFVLANLGASLVEAAEEKSMDKVAFRNIEVSGEVEEEEDAPDQELQNIDRELRNNKKNLKLLTQKEGKYKKLVNVVEKMSERHIEYVSAKGDYEDVVGKYNKQVECSTSINKDKAECQEIFPSKKQEKVDAAAATSAPASTPTSAATSNSKQDRRELTQYAKEDVFNTLQAKRAELRECHKGELIEGQIQEGSVDDKSCMCKQKCAIITLMLF
ncbi:MAG: hypothetical protein HQK50_19515, partial [Oligoflexia bacterium]|nr:hypothetical protein [Oligoflexia bacterium]